ncbi:transposase [Streptomyces sp. NPDC007910]|uniref:transposase n=1 Tax=Streptomyces sp. NPDC007910 TaxID=3364790 RepID=UPI0036F0C07D
MGVGAHTVVSVGPGAYVHDQGRLVLLVEPPHRPVEQSSRSGDLPTVRAGTQRLLVARGCDPVRAVPEALLSLLYVPEPLHFNLPAVSCDCLAHVYGNAADRPDRVRRYPSDMTDAERAAVRPLLPVPARLQGRGGRPEGHCHRRLLDAIRYLATGGTSWRAMPADFPAWGRVYAFFRRWRKHGLITGFHDRLRGRVREREGREASPTAGIIDAQSARAAATVPTASRGYDGGRRYPGQTAHRDRHARPAPGRRGDRLGHRRPGRRDGPAEAAAAPAPRRRGAAASSPGCRR